MSLVLDTNILIEVERNNDEIKQQIDVLTQQFDGEVFITSPTLSEFFHGILKSNKDKAIALKSISKYYLLNTNKFSSIIFAELKHKFEREGKIISLFDLFIASICIAHGKTIVTMDKDFSHISELNSIILKK